MGKYAYAVLMVFVIEFALWIFTGTEYLSTSLFDMLSDPSTLKSNALYIVLAGAIATFGVSAIVPGTFFQNQISFMYLTLAVAFLSFSFSIVHLWQFIYGELSGITPQLALIITITFVAPILAYYVVATIEWVRSN